LYSGYATQLVKNSSMLSGLLLFILSISCLNIFLFLCYAPHVGTWGGCPIFCLFLMNHNRNNRAWSILSWNIRGINSQLKWDHIRSKIFESSAQIVCLQETKRDVFDQSFISNFYPRPSINLPLFPRWVPLVAFLSVGMVTTSRRCD
jgi:hypothetical protein